MRREEDREISLLDKLIEMANLNKEDRPSSISRNIEMIALKKEKKSSIKYCFCYCLKII